MCGLWCLLGLFVGMWRTFFLYIDVRGFGQPPLNRRSWQRVVLGQSDSNFFVWAPLQLGCFLMCFVFFFFFWGGGGWFGALAAIQSFTEN